MRQNSWLLLVLQLLISYVFNLRWSTLLQELFYLPLSIVLSFSFFLNPSLCYPSLPGACFLINSKNCTDEVKLFMCGSVVYTLFLLGEGERIRRADVQICFYRFDYKCVPWVCVGFPCIQQHLRTATWNQSNILCSGRNRSIDWSNW